MRVKRCLYVLIFLVSGLVFLTQTKSVYAECWNYSTDNYPDCDCVEYCQSVGTTIGVSCYNNNCSGHGYECDTICGGGGGGCPAGTNQIVDFSCREVCDSGWTVTQDNRCDPCPPYVGSPRQTCCRKSRCVFTCPSGQVIYCPDPPVTTCVANCGDPNDWLLDETRNLIECAGKEELGNLKYLCRQCSCVTPTPSCTLSLTPATATVIIDGTSVLTAGLSNVQWGSVSNVTFTSSDISVATRSPWSDISSPYTTTVTGVAPGTATITARAIMDGGVRCSDTSTITVPPPPSCSVTGSTSVIVNTPVNYCVNASNAGEGAGIWKSPTTSQTWTNIRPVGAVGCSQTSFAQTGTYYVVCNAFGLGGACSGNPWCPWPPVALPEASCSYVDCTANDVLVVKVTSPGAWWQVKDADVTTNGNIISPIPGTCTLPACNPVFGLKGAGGFPGVPAYGGATADFLFGAGTGNAAESPYNWLAASRYLGRTYDYAYFKRQIPDDVVINELIPPITGGTFNSGGAPSRGYVWYHWNGATLGDLIINGNINLVGSRRVVLMAEGANVTISGQIQLQNPGQGFFMMVVGKNANGLKGDILVDPSVTNIEGIFLAESEFKTGLASTQFNARGSVVAYEGVSLQRDLGAASNANTPAEVFTYAADIIATFPSVFAQRRIRWKEVAP